MPRYLVTHRVTKFYKTQEDWVDDWSGLRQRASGEEPDSARWLCSWFASRAGKLYCEWDAPDEESIRACFTQDEIEMAPIVSVEEVVVVEAGWLE